MANKILVGMGTPIVWAGATYTGDGGSKTRAITLTSLNINAARQGQLADMDTGGVTNRFSRRFSVTMRIEYGNGDPAIAGKCVDLYWGPRLALSDSAVPGGLDPDGDDLAYTGTVGSTLNESVEQLDFLGSLLLTADESIQQTTFFVMLPTQFGQPVVVNRGEQLIDDDNEMSITFTPYEYEVQ